MDKQHLAYVCQQYLNNTASAAELRELETALADPGLDSDLKEILEEFYYQMPVDQIQQTDYPAKAESLKLILSYPQRTKKASIWPRWAAAAMLVLSVGAGTLYYLSIKQASEKEQIANNRPIIPGGTGATLTLSNGRKIVLGKANIGELAKEAGITVSKTTDGRLVYRGTTLADDAGINTISTARGETYQLDLPDGSKVWLNAASSLSYHPNLEQRGKRTVELTGEAYFEVAKKTGKPFIVNSRNQKVTVLGTHFNISTYPDDTYGITTLIEGAININGKLLHPNDQATQQQGNIKISQVNALAATDWKNGEFICNNEPLENLMKKVSRWYDVEVVFNKPSLRNATFSGSISRYAQVTDLIKALNFSGIKCKIVQRKILITE